MSSDTEMPIDIDGLGDEPEELGEDSGESDDEASTSGRSGIDFRAPNTLIVVTGVVKAVGGFRPSILVDVLMCTVHLTPNGGATLRSGHSPESLQLSVRYEPPSPKFTRQKPNCTSYRLQMLQGSQFLYLVRGLPKTLLLDTKAQAISWGQMSCVFQKGSDLSRFLAALRYVEVEESALWSPGTASAWTQLPTAATPSSAHTAEQVPATSSAKHAPFPQRSAEPSNAWPGMLAYCDSVVGAVARLPSSVLLGAGAAVVAAVSAGAWLYMRGASRR